VLADRYRKRVILLWTQVAMGLTGLALGLLFMVVVIAAPTGLMGWLRAAVGARGR
jgi:hypothetical protein